LRLYNGGLDQCLAGPSLLRLVLGLLLLLLLVWLEEAMLRHPLLLLIIV
jgi:hypothetical protein